MIRKRKQLYYTVFTVTLISLVLINIVVVRKQGRQEQYIQKIQSDFDSKDSLIHEIKKNNSLLYQENARLDSLVQKQDERLRKYEKQVDSLKVISDILRRSDLHQRYRSK